MAADAMRRDPTPEEEVIWQLVKDKGWGFELQVPVWSTRYNKGWILDLYSPLKQTNIEIDGPQHRKSADQRRDRKLQADLGVATIRFTNREVNRKLPKVIEMLEKLFAES